MSNITEPIAYQIYNWYADIERRLSEIVHILPFVEYSDLKNIRSPRLASILLESASLIDTILRDQLPNSFVFVKNGKTITKQNASTCIEHYFQELQPIFKFSDSKSILLSGIPTILNPFEVWASQTYTPLSWWQTYNGLKHDRLVNSSSVTLETCLQATCALNQVMMKIPAISKYVFRFKWADPAGVNIEIAIDDFEGRQVANQAYIAYTDFFATFLCHTNYITIADIEPQRFRNCERLQTLLSKY
jgi:hypothetical protein